MRASRNYWRALVLTAIGVFAAGLNGCGTRRYPVTGAVALEDGTPVTKGMIIAERVEGGDAITVQGEIRADGTFQLGTTKPGDGVPPGKYRVLINSMDLSDLPDEQKDLPYDAKYLSFKTSGLELEVKRGATDFPIKLARSTRPSRR